jgi:Fe-S-cluster-containing hydrogenase component 2
VVLSYLPRGSCFGEIALLSNEPRGATCAALDHVEVVKIESDDFRAMLAEFPAIQARLQELRAERERQNATIARRGAASDLEAFLAQGLMEAQNLLLLDLERCTRCDECVKACSDAHDGVARFTRDGPRFGKYLVTMACRSCTDPKCMVGCPVGSIRRTDSLEIQIEDWCIGCERCANQCPFGNINMVERPAAPAAKPEPGKEAVVEAVKLKATVCDLCSGYDSPNCVYACPHDAAIRVNPAEFLSATDTR